MTRRFEVAICGAGIAGVATAYHLAVRCGLEGIVLVDSLPPLSFTSSKSGENIRDYWPQACMAEFSRRSIELMEELAVEAGDGIGLKFSVYNFVSESPGREIFPADSFAADPRQDAGEGSRAPLRISGRDLIGEAFPWLSPGIEQVVQIRRAGAVDAYALGSLMLKSARGAGVRLLNSEVSDLRQGGSGGFELQLERHGDTTRLLADRLVLAAGPFNNDLASMLGFDLPIKNFLQRKIVVRDPLGLVPRDMPFTIFADPQKLAWRDDEREMIGQDSEFRWLLDELPAGLHIKPESRDQIKLGWAYNRNPEKPRWQCEDDPYFPDIVMRGASRFIPALTAYVENMPTPVVQMAGYYSRTSENWPLIGPLGDEGLFTVAALSGFGTMMACAAGELCAAWMTGGRRPGYARHFHPDRYRDEAVMAEIAKIRSDGQL